MKLPLLDIRPTPSLLWTSKRDKIMIQETPQADRFKQRLHDSLVNETLNSRAITIANSPIIGKVQLAVRVRLDDYGIWPEK